MNIDDRTPAEIAQDAFWAMENGKYVFDAMDETAWAIKDLAFRELITSIIDSARTNASDTVNEGACGQAEWLSMANSTLDMILDSDDRSSPKVRAWFLANR
jgi:hypothetical protein